MIPPALLPFTAAYLARTLADHASLHEPCPSTPWGRFATLAYALTYCITNDERRLLFREAARRARAWRDRGPLGSRLAAWYGELATLAFRASRWTSSTPSLAAVVRRHLEASS